MGMSASQARLLTITSRLSDLELRAQNISNAKIRLSQESGEISKAYAQALDQENFQVLTGYNNNGSGIYSDVTYNNLMNPASALGGQYCLTDENGSILVDNKTATNFESANGSLQAFLTAYDAQTTVQTNYGPNYATALQTYNTAKAATSTALTTLDTYGKNYVDGYTNKGAWSRTEKEVKGFTTNYNDSDIYAYLNKNCKDSNNNSYSKDGSSNVILLEKKELYGSNGEWIGVSRDVVSYVSSVCDNVASALNNIFSQSELKNLDKIKSAITTAKGQTEFYYNNNATDEYFNSNDDYSKESNAKNAAKNGNGIGVDYGTWGLGGTDKIFIDQSQVVKTFLNYFDAACATINGDSATATTYSNQVGDDNKAATRTKNGGTGTTNSLTYGNDIAYNSTDSADGLTNIKYKQETDSDGKNVADTYKALLADYKSKVTAEAAAKTAYEAEITTSTVYGKNAKYADYYTNLFNKMSSSEGYITVNANQEDDTINNTEWLSGQIKNSSLRLEKVNDSGDWESTSWGSDTTNFTTEDDDTAIAKAEAQYESDMNKIESKDKRYDLELNNINTEHSALQTEKESVQKVIDKNIERSFKIFDA